MSNMSDKYYYRYATKDDVDLIYNWANEKEVRANSFNSNEIKYEDHVRWFDRILSDKEHNVQLILMCDDTPVGQCRLSIDNGQAIIGLSVDKNYRGTGVGNALISNICEWVRENRPDIKTLIGQIKPENEASAKAVIKSGFVETYRNYELKL